MILLFVKILLYRFAFFKRLVQIYQHQIKSAKKDF